MSQKIFNVTEARQRFFELLNMVEKGMEPLILKKNRNLIFKITLSRVKIKSDKKILLSEMSNINLKSKKPKEIKKILDTKLDI